jgi:tetratricopeptide (TPR) repeat protein
MSRMLAVASSCIVYSLVGGCGGGGTQEVERPKVDVTKSLPATLEAAHPKKGDPRPLHVHVYADTGVRALPHWKEELTDQLDYAGQLLSPLLGVRLTVDSIKDWDHAGNDVREALKALHDVEKPDDDTVWVIGYITPGDAAQRAFSELGAGDLLGRRVVVRAWAEKPETELVAARLPDVEGSARTELISAHKRHKQTVVLLHTLAQTLGAIDEADPTWIQHPLYSAKQSTFSERNRDLMQLAIDARLGGGTDQVIAHDLLEAIEKSDWGGWVPNSHDDVVKMLRNMLDAAKVGKTAADVPPAAYEQFDRVRELAKRGEFSRGLAELDNLMQAYPGNATMQEEKCELMLAKPTTTAKPAPKGAPPAPVEQLAVTEKATRQACARVSELAPGDPSPHLAVGEALLHLPKPDIAGARAELVQAATKIANLKTGQPEAWNKLIALYAGINALTWTEDAIADAKIDKHPAAAEVAQSRVRYGVPRGAKFVKPEDESALVTQTRAAVAAIGGGKLADGERMIAAAEKKWPGAPGLEAMRCDLAFRQSNLDAARAACNRSLAVDPDESWALYLSGVLALKDTSASGTKTGIDKLKHAITVDPELGQAWRALGKAYDRAHDQAAHDDLAQKYQAKFSQALP